MAIQPAKEKIPLATYVWVLFLIGLLIGAVIITICDPPPFFM